CADEGGRAPYRDRYEEADAEQLPFAAASFDLAVSRHLLWTLPNPERTIDEWIRVLWPVPRPVAVDTHANVSAVPEPLDNTHKRPEYAEICDWLSFVGG